MRSGGVITQEGFRLDGGGDSLVFLRSAQGAPRLAYWGPLLGECTPLKTLAALRDRPLGGGMLDAGEALTWSPQAGEGFTGHPAFIGHREGRAVIVQLATVRQEVASRSATILLADPLRADAPRTLRRRGGITVASPRATSLSPTVQVVAR